MSQNTVVELAGNVTFQEVKDGLAEVGILLAPWEVTGVMLLRPQLWLINLADCSSTC